MKSKLRRIKWSNLLFFLLSPLVSILGVGWVMKNGGPHAATWVLAVVMLYASGLAITAGYHRLFSHRSYDASRPLKLIFILFGSAALEGSVRWWCLEHRDHHRYVDTDKDPYGINKGFWYAHIGWLLTKEHDIEGYGNVRDLEKDPLVRFQDRHYFFFALGMGFLFPTALAALWGDPWGGLFLAGFARIVFNHHATFCINSVCHYWGRRTYSDRSSARDNGITALFTYGEGYHNFHHEFQSDYRNGVRPYHWDPGKWLIRFFAWLGWAYNLRRAASERILQAKLEMEEKRLLQRLAHHPDSVRSKLHSVIGAAREQLQQAQARLLELKRECPHLRRELVRAKREFRFAMARWRTLIRAPLLAGGFA
jgi:stearoyl-CoA desaturase (delta-9 desaturase)